MPIDDRARDVALGLAAAAQSGESTEPAMRAVIEYLLATPDHVERMTRLVSYINANTILIGTLLEVAPQWWQSGYLIGHGAGTAGGDDAAWFARRPGSELLLQQLAERLNAADPEPDAEPK